jgi:uncharacterized membrane protein YoaK (UPF0700 family)
VVAALLAMTAGATDVVSFLGLGGVFSSVMTANLVLLGLSASQHDAALATHTAAAFAGFAAGALAASRLTGPAGQRPERIGIALAGECVLLSGFTVGWEVTGGRPGGWAQLVLLATAACAMGGQSATVIALNVPGISTTYMTGMLTGVLSDLVTRGRAGVGFRLLLLGLLIGGAVANGFAFTLAPRLAPLVIMVPAVAAAIAAGRGERRDTAQFER